MIHKTTAMNMRNNLGEVLNEVQYRHDSVLITRAGKAVAALVDIKLFEKIRRMREQFDALSEELANACKDQTPDNLDQLINKAVKASRKKQSKK